MEEKETVNSKLTIEAVIEYMEATTEESWCTKVVRTEQGGNCFFGHLFAMGKDQEESNLLWDWFENCYSTTYMIYPINDGEHSGYQQPTPKQRVIAYLKNLRDKVEKTAYESIEEEMEYYNQQKALSNN